MFKFDDLDGMARAAMLLKQQEAKREYMSIKALEALWDAYGNAARGLLERYAPFKAQVEFFPELEKSFFGGRKRQEKVASYLEQLDAYMRDIDTRLCDGTKWYNAMDIQRMSDSIGEGD